MVLLATADSEAGEIVKHEDLLRLSFGFKFLHEMSLSLATLLTAAKNGAGGTNQIQKIPYGGTLRYPSSVSLS